jgi:hypothetical protein
MHWEVQRRARHDAAVTTSARRRLLIALEESDSAADVLCRDALEQGAEADLPDLTTPVETLVAIYRRRVDHLRSNEIHFVGDDCPDRLSNSGDAQVRIAVVLSPAYNFAVFLSPDADRVVSCIAVDAAAAGPPDG